MVPADSRFAKEAGLIRHKPITYTARKACEPLPASAQVGLTVLVLARIRQKESNSDTGFMIQYVVI